MTYHGSKQVEVTELTEAIATATDPLQIVNAFFRAPAAEVASLPMSEYWEKRVCLMAELFIAVRDLERRPRNSRLTRRRLSGR